MVANLFWYDAVLFYFMLPVLAEDLGWNLAVYYCRNYVEVEVGKEPIVLQLTDTQIIDAGQTRPGRGGVDHNFWATDKMDERCYDYITELVNALSQANATENDLTAFKGWL